jgi:hypothetical protein
LFDVKAQKVNITRKACDMRAIAFAGPPLIPRFDHHSLEVQSFFMHASYSYKYDVHVSIHTE